MGLSLAVPGRVTARNVRELKLSGFPQLVYGLFWNGRLSEPARVCLEIARKMAKSL